MNEQETKRLSWDIFKGNSPDKGVSIIITFLFIYAIAIALIAVVIGGIVSKKPITMDDKRVVTIQVQEVKRNKTYTRLYIEDENGTRYMLNNSGVLNREERDIIYRDGIWLTLVIDDYLGNDGCYSIWAISTEDCELLTFADVDRYSYMGLISVLILLLLLLAAWITVTVLTVISGRNPKKYPRLVRIMFKPGYIKSND